MNNDVVLEILSHLPVRSLFRFRTVCKFWRDIIDSPRFRKVHSTNKDKDEEVYLQYALRCNSLSIMLLDIRNQKPLTSHYFPGFDTKPVIINGPVKGLLCLSPSDGMQPIAIAICNPFLGQSKILPVSPSSSSHSQCNVAQRCGICFDQDYKVVQIVWCPKHRCIEANLYSKRTNSWKKMSIDKKLLSVSPIKSLCKNGSFAHWAAWELCNLTGENRRIILSFDMKNEVFRTITLPYELWTMSFEMSFEILAKGEYSFVVIGLDILGKVKVYESSGEGSELVWIHVANMEVESPMTPILRSYIVVLRLLFLKNEWVLYDYRARKFIAGLMLPAGSAIIEYKGSLVSP